MANGLSGFEIYSIAEDRNHNLWIGSNESAMKINQSDFSTFTAADGLNPALFAHSLVRVTSVFQDRLGALIVTIGGRARREPFLSRLEGD